MQSFIRYIPLHKNIINIHPVREKYKYIFSGNMEKPSGEGTFQVPVNKIECFFYFRFEKMRKGCILRV